MAKILIVDDENNILNVLSEYAKFNGFEVETAQNGYEAIEKVIQNKIDCIIMDIMMPELDGYKAIEEIRKIKTIPIMLMSAKSDEYDILKGFDLGIDDYIVKPFSPKEVIARIKAVLRRIDSTVNCTKEDGIEINTEAHEVNIDNKKVELTVKEYELLLLLIKNKNLVLKREKILNEIWGYDYEGDDRTIDTHIKTLRSRIKPYSNKIKTIHGVGYKFESTTKDEQ